MLRGMPDFIPLYSLPALFLVSFLASTLLPLGSEWLLVALLLGGTDPYAAVITASCGNSLGALSNYAIGCYGYKRLGRKALARNRIRLRQARSWFNRYGSYSLLFSWLPLIGDPLCLLSGIMRTPLLRFTILVSSGKLLRYSGLALVTLGIINLN